MGDNCFRIGLAMAGAVSAGAYSAGVLDFLVEALDAWHAAKARGEAVPRHAVSLEAASGASAGAMCAALLAAALPYRFPHARLDARRRPDARAGENPFYRAWVRDIGIAPLLGTADLAGGPLKSLLDCTALDGIVQAALDFAGPAQPRPYVRRPFVARFTLGNLRGVPYTVNYRGTRPASDTLYAHADFQGFLVGGEPPRPLPPHLAGHRLLGAEPSAADPAWRGLGEAALASGAFPFFLKPRLLSRPGSDYAALRFGTGDPALPGGSLSVPPAWGDGAAPAAYDYVCMDGGLFNNEPLELAREVVAGGYGCRMPRSGALADRAVLMIAPFVSRPGAGTLLPVAPLHQLIAPLLFSLVAQCRFAPQDLALAQDETVYSRFLLAPTGSKSPPGAPYWIAGGPLEGFFGFLHEEFRKHDYQLGRRNCQRFLQRHFTLPADNPIVAAGYAELAEPQLRAWRTADGELPIVPLTGTAVPEEPACDWPAGQLDVEEILHAARRRADAVSAALRAGIGGPWLRRQALGLLARAGWIAARPPLQRALRQALEDARSAQQL
ncbi:MAG: patatin-like phospholipase family protein [Nevskia sp.]|nr:patatin-like phospholipase family protein [Nevskia sp.]